MEGEFRSELLRVRTGLTPFPDIKTQRDECIYLWKDKDGKVWSDKIVKSFVRWYQKDGTRPNDVVFDLQMIESAQNVKLQSGHKKADKEARRFRAVVRILICFGLARCLPDCW